MWVKIFGAKVMDFFVETQIKLCNQVLFWALVLEHKKSLYRIATEGLLIIKKANFSLH